MKADVPLDAVLGKNAFDLDRILEIEPAFLEAEAEVVRMRDDIQHFIATWLPAYVRDNRNYLTVAIGCTGGQHRSVYFAEWLGRKFRDQARVLIRHRTLAGG